jgi:hypothetical protein
MKVRSLVAAAISALVLARPLAARAAVTSDAAGCAACSGCGGILIVFWLSLVAIQIALLVWVAKDAKARGMDSAILWMLLVLFFPLLGLLLYVLTRPKGDTAPCPNCSNKRLVASVRCPHCGAGS